MSFWIGVAAILTPMLIGCGKSTDPKAIAPEVSDIPDQRIAPGEHFEAFDLDDFVEDPDNPDSEITWTFSGNAQIAVTIDEGHVVTLKPPSVEWEGVEVITFTATDPNGRSDSDSMRAMAAVNYPPVLSDLPQRMIANQGEAFLPFDLDDFVEDPNDSEEDIIWTVTDNSELSVEISADHGVRLSPPSSDWLGLEVLLFTANDPWGMSDSASMRVGVGPKPVEGKVFVANSWPFKSLGGPTGGNICVIDAATNEVVRTFPVGEVPFDMVPSPDGRFLYVVNRGLEFHPDIHVASSVIWIVDVQSGEKIHEIKIYGSEAQKIDPETGERTETKVGKNPGQIALSPDGDKAYVIVTRLSKETTKGIAVLDLISNQVTWIIPLSGFPYGLAMSSDGSFLYATNLGMRPPIEGVEVRLGILSVINTQTWEVDEIDLEETSYGICLSPDDRLAYVTKPFEDIVQVLDTASGAIVADIPVGNAPLRIAISPDGKRLYVPNRLSEDLSIIDTESLKVIDTVEVGPGPEGVLVTPEGRFVYVTNRNPGDTWTGIESPEGSVTVIDTVDDAVIATIAVEEEPIAMCFIADR